MELPESINYRMVESVEIRLFLSPGYWYDIMFGRDFLCSTHIELCFHANTVNWLSIKLDIKPVDHYMIDDVQPVGFYKENILTMWYVNKGKITESEMFEST